MKRSLTILYFLFFTLSTYGQQVPKLKTGTWTGKLSLQNGSKILPFKWTLDGYSVSIYNASEQIKLDQPIINNDSLVFQFPTFNSQLVVKALSKKHLKGYWINKNKNVRIPCEITYGYVHRFNVNQPRKINVTSDKWEVTFDEGTKDSYKGQAILQQELTKVSGTIRTETGDFKFLEGNVTGDSIYLSRFDGAHVLLIEGKIDSTGINGYLFSGKSGKSSLKAVINAGFELTHPDSLTYVTSSTPLQFQLKNRTGEEYNFPNSTTKGKVVIIELMGSWCPNCLDEAYFLKELYALYPREQVEIISVAYEIGDQFEQYVERISRMTNKLEIPYIVLIGGKASKQVASEQFPLLNRVISFPTTLIIDKKGTIRKVHTGFNGPATGSFYTDFKRDMQLFIDQLIAE